LRAGFKAGETEPSGFEPLLASLRNVRRAM